jgi:hypothetical protein
MRAQRADLQRLNRQLKVIYRGCGRREVQDGIQIALNENIVCDIVLDVAEAFVAGQVRDIIGAAGDQVIHRDNRVPFGEEAFAEVRAKKARAASYQNTHSIETLLLMRFQR